MKDPISTKVLVEFVRKLKINATSTKLKEDFEAHPDFPSFLAMSDVLENLKTPNQTYNIGIESFVDIEPPFLAHIKDNSNALLLVDKVINDNLIVHDRNNQTKIIPLSDFSSGLTSNVLVAYPNENSSEENFKGNRRREIFNRIKHALLLSVIIFAGIFLMVTNNNATGSQLFLTDSIFFIKDIGLSVSVLLLIQSIDSTNSLVQKFCSFSKNANCDSILSSDAAKVFDSAVTWSEVGFTYFSGTWLISIWAVNSASVFQLLMLLNILSLPYTVYSIIYQYKVAKQWCLLCCAIQAILWIEFIPLISLSRMNFELPSVTEILYVVICLILPVMAWSFLKPYLILSNQVTPLKKQVNKFKFNRELFGYALSTQNRYPILNDENSIIMGNQDAKNIITIISNPYCNPCAKAHKLLENWLENIENFKLQIVFAPNGDDGKYIARQLLSHKLEHNKETVHNAVSDWFSWGQKNLQQWQLKYPVDEKELAHQISDHQINWCKSMQLKRTPTILFNGYDLPDTYSLEDLKVFINK